MGMSVHMHFRTNLNANERLTCARVCEYGNENVINIGNQKHKKVDKVKFLGIMIDEKLYILTTWPKSLNQASL